jgi:hypothetical protein
MGDAFRKVGAGQKLRISARAYNTMLDAAQDYLNRKQSSSASPLTGAIMGNFVRVRNDSSSDCVRFAVLGIAGTVFDPTAATSQFKNSVVLSCNVPTVSDHAQGKFVICSEPIGKGKIGLAWASGTCQVQINVNDANHLFATVKDNDAAMLDSAASGPISILWKQAGTGTRWAIVRFGASGGGTSAASISWGTIIEAPVYADPASFSLSGGRGYYTIRPVGTTYDAWSSTANYLKDDVRLYNNLLYKSLQGTSTSPNIGHVPDESGSTWWTKQDEIRVEHAMGADGLDIRLFTPWFAAGKNVPIISQMVGGAARWYIWAALTYGGTDDQASIRWNQEDQRAIACYK